MLWAFYGMSAVGWTGGWLAAGMGQAVEICAQSFEMFALTLKFFARTGCRKAYGTLCICIAHVLYGFVVCSKDIISKQITSEDELVYVHWVTRALRLWNGSVFVAFAFGVHACSTCAI